MPPPKAPHAAPAAPIGAEPAGGAKNGQRHGAAGGGKGVLPLSELKAQHPGLARVLLEYEEAERVRLEAAGELAEARDRHKSAQHEFKRIKLDVIQHMEEAQLVRVPLLQSGQLLKLTVTSDVEVDHGSDGLP